MTENNAKAPIPLKVFLFITKLSLNLFALSVSFHADPESLIENTEIY